MKTIIQLSLALTVAVMSMVITACGSDDDPVTESPSLSVPVRNYSVAQNGETLKISLSTNQTNISVDVAEDGKGWIHPSSITPQSVSLIVDKSEEVAPRTATVTIEAGSLSETIQVTQQGGKILTLAKTEYTISEAGGNVYIDTESNFKYEVNIDVDWIQEVSNDSRALSKSTIALYVHPNENYDSREATITLCDPSSQEKKTLTIVQAQKNAIVLAKHFYEIEKDGGEMTFDVGANVDYDIQVDASWISQKTSRALSYKQVTFVISPNYSEVERTATISFANKNIDMVQTITIKQKIGNAINGHGFVDLGLPSGLKWATCNVGATSMIDDGDYFAWGETVGYGSNKYRNFNDATYKFYMITTTSATDKDGFTIPGTTTRGYTKYVRKAHASKDGYDGFYDDKTVLDPEDDAATANWGGSWRMPTKAELDELCIECTWQWSSINGKNGCKVTGPNGNFIFFPASGFRDVGTDYYININISESRYWSSSLHSDGWSSSDAYYLEFNSDGVNRFASFRFFGHPVRAVSK